MRRDKNSASLADALEGMRNYFELVYGLRTQSEMHGKGGPGGGGKTVHGHVSLEASEWEAGTSEADLDDPFDFDVKYTVDAKSALSQAERIECDNRDECPAEHETIEEIKADIGDGDLTVDPNGDLTVDPSSYETIIGGAANHIDMANQLLWFSYNVPTVHEIARFFHTSFTYVRTRLLAPRLDATQLEELEAITLGTIMIATGASLERACKLVVYKEATTDTDADLALVLDEVESKACWLIRAPLPIYKTPQVIADLTQVVALPDLIDAGYLVRLLLRSRLDSDVAVTGQTPIFPDKGSSYAKALRRLLYKVDSSERLTIAKLPNFIFAHLVREATGDVGDACFASAHWLNLARVSTYYATPSLSRLQNLYARTANRLGVVIRAAVQTLAARGNPPHDNCRPFSTTELGFLPKKNSDRVGNRACPTKKVVQEAMSAIKDEIALLDRLPVCLDPIRLHNFYTLYVLEFFAASVGIRGVTTPYLFFNQVDEETGFAVLTEKTIRPVWLPPKLVQQMRHYRDYLTKYKCARPLPTFRGRPASCFLLDQRGNELEVTPKVKTTFLQEYAKFNYAASVFRRFIRNELRESGCPGPVVEAWLSHASRGEEIYHKYSQFSLGAYREALQHYLLPILEDLGFKPLELKTCPQIPPS